MKKVVLVQEDTIDAKQATVNGIIIWFDCNGNPEYKLNRVGENNYAFVCLDNTNSWANGTFDSIYEAVCCALNSHKADLRWFINVKEFIAYIKMFC